MWNETMQQRLNELQRFKQDDKLTEQERQALEQLHSALEQEEWSTLRPTLERLRREQEQQQEQEARLKVENSVLAALAERMTR